MTAPVLTHPDYDAFRSRWLKLAHVADGTGGFLDGTYLIPHPREWKDFDKPTPNEPTKKLLERRALARYDHLATLIIETKLAGLFRQPPIRRCAVDGHPYLSWLTDVDGAGHTMDEFLRALYRLSLIFGHAFTLMDRTRDDGPTEADKAPLVLRLYTPLDATDWLTDDSGVLTGIQLEEPLPRTDFAQSTLEVLRVVHQIRTETARKFVVGRETEPAALNDTAHGFGVLPVVPIYAHRRAGSLVIGQSALYDPALYIDLYNLASEMRELLRKQTFSILNVPLGRSQDGGPATSLDAAQSLMGQTSGSNSVLFSTEPAQYLTADTANVQAYQQTIDALIRHVLRLTAVPFDVDSRDAESAESRRLRREDFSTVLAGYADELQRAEMDIARLWFRGTYGLRWQQEWDRARLEIVWPSAFDPIPFAEVLEQAAAAQALPVGESRTFRTEHSARLLEQFLPGASEETLATIRNEIDAIPTPDEQRQSRMESLADKFRAPARPTPPATAA